MLVCVNIWKSLNSRTMNLSILYIELTENWLRLGTAAHHLNAASGFVSVLNGVDIIRVNVTENNQIIVA